jgi:hypothetical protein
MGGHKLHLLTEMPPAFYQDFEDSLGNNQNIVKINSSLIAITGSDLGPLLLFFASASELGRWKVGGI